jgi:hypothetical protein
MRDAPYIEPHGDIKSIAGTVRQVYNALHEVGFDNDQAMMLTDRWFKAILQQRPQ